MAKKHNTDLDAGERPTSFIDRLGIENFKSIKKLNLSPKRVNLFIGRPNTGKSNILEGLGILATEVKLHRVVRYRQFSNIFHNNEFTNEILITTNKTKVSICIDPDGEKFNLKREDLYYKNQNRKPVRGSVVLENDGNQNELIQHFPEVRLSSDIKSSQFTSVRFYRYFEKVLYQFKTYSFLMQPEGDNLIELIRSNSELRDRAGAMVEEYGFGLGFPGNESKIDFIINLQDANGRKLNTYTTIPFELGADTFKRFLFYLAAIITNKNWIIVLEEPEVHSYPPYIKTLAEEISAAKSNQFFIATHSPYLLETLYENAEDDELQVFVVDYQNHQTVVHPVDNEALGELIANRADVFFNLHNLVS